VHLPGPGRGAPRRPGNRGDGAAAQRPPDTGAGHPAPRARRPGRGGDACLTRGVPGGRPPGSAGGRWRAAPSRPHRPSPAGPGAGGGVGGGRGGAGGGRTVTDCTPLTKVQLRAPVDGEVAAWLGVPFGRAARDPDGTLVVGSGPGEWLLLAPPGEAGALEPRL